ncbi:MAG: sugar phosphate isomerase/epimerase [Lentisphaerae bacterium]|jgi:sugar phosphate isomerase/epimerase|nr:sugar phosphate isomerase/epimerase [Lentisphaerota bacterium]MBT4814149.1 sugar phosphate isomerase/epimerase [Lentisphaerota bacterium]MBT5607117.1 sugar phosphate isomerase/epimerase [Lentisphaerota bacterium]MBT7053519.1 sugar phosphate isomerase/epimerase [Lentisphaerota bacterium]MBT7842725.1 sugar phosphate isomerase/epimerase [Lentisphaerota bacterium]
MDMKLGLHTCGWGDRPVPGALVAARKLGYDGVELAPAWLEKAYDGLAEIDRFLVQEDVPLAPAVFVGGPRIDDAGLAESVDQTTRYARWARQHGGDRVIYSTVQGKDGLRTNEERERLRHAWDAVAEAAAAEGCTPLYHNHYVVSHEVSRALLEKDMELIDWSQWKLCVDTGHLVLALHDPVSFVEEWSDKIAWMHCKDVKTCTFQEPETHRPMATIVPHFTSLGTGVVDFGRIVATLARTGYDGWLVVEQDASPDPYAMSRASCRHMQLAMGLPTS